MPMIEIPLDRNLSLIDLDVVTDPDHYAKYKLFLWKKVRNKWTEIPDAVTPKEALNKAL
jgi:hypothetical protein